MTPAPDSPQRRLRVAVVVQRYGLEVNGGAEAHARLFVERVRPVHDVTVLTTRAKDYTAWDDFYPVGDGKVDGTPVIRFDHPRRGHCGRARVARRHLLRYRLDSLLTRLRWPRVAHRAGNPATDGEDFLECQGPFCPALVQHVAAAQGRYDVMVFFTALYYPTAVGLPACPVPTVLVPTLHNERAMYQPVYRDVFTRAAWVLWNCSAEQQLASKLYGDGVAAGTVCGVGIETPQVDPAARRAFLQRLGIDAPYFLFVGRISRSKGFGTLVRAFARFSSRHGGGIKLLVLGQGFMDTLPQHPHLVYGGFVGDAERDALMAGALATVVTSKHESLSLVTLESMAMETPVIVNGRSEVLQAHVDDSGCGVAYGLGGLAAAFSGFVALSDDERKAMGRRGKAYVQRQYSWPRVQQAWLEALQRTALPPRAAVSAVAEREGADT